MITSQEIGERLRARRKFLHLTQEDVARQIPIGRAGYNRYETGKVAVPVQSLDKLAKILRVPVSYFYDDADASTVDERDLLTVFRRVPPSMRQAAINLVTALSVDVPEESKL